MTRILLTYFFILITAICFVKAIEYAKGIQYKIISPVDIDYLSADGASTQNMNEEENESNSNNHLKHASNTFYRFFISKVSHSSFSFQFNNSHLQEVVVPPPDFI